MGEELAARYHSISFVAGQTAKNSWTDYKLIPSTRPVVVPPPVKTNYVDVPGADGSLDFTSALDNRVHYGMREGEWEFYVCFEEIANYNWAALWSQLLADLHGKEFAIQLMDEASSQLYYFGRVFLDGWNSDESRSRVVIKYILEPFKYASEEARASASGGVL